MKRLATRRRVRLRTDPTQDTFEPPCFRGHHQRPSADKAYPDAMSDRAERQVGLTGSADSMRAGHVKDGDFKQVRFEPTNP